jgi:hypothetical protein
MWNPHGPLGRIVNAFPSETIICCTTTAFCPNTAKFYAEALTLVLPDPNGLPFLEVANSDGADALITGNVEHFKLRRGQHSVLTTTPADFLRRHR